MQALGLPCGRLGLCSPGVSFNYGWLLFARIFTGAGLLSPPLILVL